MPKRKTLKSEFKKHYRYAMRLKEGGAAWEREMQILETLKTEWQRREKERLKVAYC